MLLSHSFEEVGHFRAPPRSEALQDGLDRLKQRSEDLKAAIVAKKREAAQLQKKRSQALEHQLRRVRSRLSSQERKLRTRRLIVLGGLMEQEFPPATLLSKLDRSLDRDQDRALFGLLPQIPRRRRSPLYGTLCTPRGLAAGPGLLYRGVPDPGGACRSSAWSNRPCRASEAHFFGGIPPKMPEGLIFGILRAEIFLPCAQRGPSWPF